MATPIEQAINSVVRPIECVQPSADGLPYVTHSGVLELVPGLVLNVYRLSNGKSVVDEKSMAAFLAYLGGESVEVVHD